MALDLLSQINSLKKLREYSNGSFLLGTTLSEKSFFSKLDENAISNYTNTYKELLNSENMYVLKNSETFKELDKNMQGFTINAYKAEMSVEEFNKSLTAMSRAGAVVKSVLNGLATAAIAFIVSLAIKKIDEWIHRAEHMAQAASAAKTELDSISSSFKNSIQTVDSLKKRYAELAQGVENLGTAYQSQGRLSTEEYAEFLDISNQLVQIFPTLTQGYDENGQAIVKLKGDIDGIVGALDNLIERQRILTRSEIKDKMPELWNNYLFELYGDGYVDGYIENLDKVESDYERYLKALEFYNKKVSILNGEVWFTNSERARNEHNIQHQYYDETFDYEMYNTLVEVLEKAGLKMEDIMNEQGLFSFYMLPEEEKQAIQNAFQEIIKEYSNDAKLAESKIEEINQEAKSYLYEYLSLDNDFAKLDENVQNAISEIISNFDITKLPDGSQDMTFDELADWYTKNVVYALSNINNQDILEAITALLTGEGTLADAEQIYEMIYDYFVNQQGMSEDNPLIVHLKAELDSQKSTVQQALDRLLYNVGPDKDLRQQYAIGLRTLLEGASDEFVNWVANDLTIPEGTIYSEQKLLDMWEELHTTIEETTEAAKRFGYQAVDSLADAEAAINSLNDLYWEVANKNPDAEESDLWGYADPAKINSIEQAFMKLAESEDEATKAQLNLALKEFEETLVRFPNDAEKAQEAINKLITAYINENEILSDLTEENQEYIKARLESIGVINAEEVVQSRLSTTTKATIEAVDALRDAYNNYYETLNSKEPDSEAYKQAIDDLASYVSEALQQYDENGKPIEELFEVSPEFVQEHLEDVQKLMNGDEDALRRLQKEVARQKFIMQFETFIPEEDINHEFEKIYDRIDNLPDIELGASIDDTTFLITLNNMANASRQVALEMAEYFRTIYGVELTVAGDKWSKRGGSGLLITGATKIGESGLGNQAKYGPKPPSDNGKDGGGGSSEDKDPIVEKFEQDKEHLDWLRDQDLISQQEYLDQLAILIQNSFGDNEKYADKYYEHMHDLMEQTKDYFDTAISAVNTILDKQIDKLEDLEKAEKKPYETANKEIDKNIRKLEKQTTSIDEVTKSLERQKETIQSKKIDPIQRQIDEIERTYIRPIEREIDALEKGKLRDLQDKINGVWGTDGLDDFIEKANREIQSIQDDLIDPVQKEIDLRNENIENIQKEIDKMNEANTQRKTALDLQRAAWELEKARNQRVNLIYTDDDQLGGQLRYRPSEENIRTAQTSYEDAVFQKEIQTRQDVINSINDEIDGLNEIIKGHEKTIEVIQERIDGWEKEKQAIQDEIDALNDYIEYLNRSKEPWEQRIQDLQDEMEIYQLQTETIDRQIEQQNEKKQILEDQLDILNKQKDANEEAITLIEEKYEPLKTQLEEYKKLWTDLADTQEYADAIEALNNFGIKTEEILNGSKETFNEFSSAYYSVLKGITDGNAEALAALSTATNGASDAVKPYIEAMSPYLDKLQALDLTDTNTALASARELAGQLGTNFSLAERAAMVLGDTIVGKGGKGGVISAIMTELGDGETPGTLIGAAAEYKNTLDESKTSTEELGTTTTATMDETKSVIDEVGNPALDDLKKHTDDNVTSMTNLKDEVGRLGDMIDSLPDSKDITITIKEVHEKVSVGSASGASKFNGTVGNAFADGYPGLKSNEKDALRSEFGQPELSVYPNGTYELTTTPTISDLPKGTVIFNGEQTKKILSQNGKKSKAFASGSSQYLSLQDVMPEKAAIFERFNANLQANMEALKMNTFDMSRNVSDIAKAVITNNFGNNVVVNGGINVTCPGVTEAEVARNIAPIIQDQFTSIFSGMALRADQRAMRR